MVLPDDVRRIVDALGDGLLISDLGGRILYANPAAEDVLGRPGRPVTGGVMGDLFSPAEPEVRRRFDEVSRDVAGGVSEHRLYATLTGGDGAPVRLCLVVSAGPTRAGQQVVITLLRDPGGPRLRQLQDFTKQLLDVLTASSSSAPAEQLLEALGRQLGWEVAALWAVDPDGTLACLGAWTTPEAPAAEFVEEKLRHRKHDAGGLARLVMERGEPIWFTDVASNERFTSQALRADGLTSACAFPIRYAGRCVGAVKLYSRAAREPDADVIALLDAVTGHLGEVLHALEQQTENRRLLAELEDTRQRLEFLLRANRVVAEASGYAETLGRLAEVAVPTLGDLCLIDVVDEYGTIQRLAACHADPAKRSLADELLTRYAPDPEGAHPSAEVMRTGESRWSAEMSDEFLVVTSRDERHVRILRELEFTSYMTVPLRAGDRVLGTVTLVSAGSGRRYGAPDLEGAEELAAQIVGIVERAHDLDRERNISHQLQRSLLPEGLPRIPGLQAAARYVPATTAVEVGGDWFDLIDLEHGRAAVVVGDVEGHDMVAASIMGRLRHGLCLLVSEGLPPDEALQRLHRFGASSGISHLTTVLVVVLDPDGGLTMASAGHPAPVAVGPAGARILPVRPGPPLGVRGATYRAVPARLDDETVVLFTDGLVERRQIPIDRSIDALLRTLEGLDDRHPEAVVTDLTARLDVDHASSDDVVVLAARPARA